MSAKREPEGGIGRSMDEATSEALAREGLNPNMVETWEDGYRTADQPDAFEWWYFDSQFDDGSNMAVVFSTKAIRNAKGPLSPTVSLSFKPRDGKGQGFSSSCGPEEFKASTRGCDLRVGKNRVKGDLRRYDLRVDADGLKADLVVTGQAPPWRPGSGVTYFDYRMTRYFASVVAVPYGTVEGTITRGGKPQQVTGTVYHDHYWGNSTMGNLVDQWYWGRAHVGEFSLIFVELVGIRVLGFGGAKGHVFYLARGGEVLTDDGLPLTLVMNDFKKGPGGHTYPEKLDFEWHSEEGDVQIALRRPRLVETVDVLAGPTKLVRPLIYLYRSPFYYYGFDSELELKVDLSGVRAREHGRATFEKMMFS